MRSPAGREDEIGLPVEQDLLAGTGDELLQPLERLLAERNQSLAPALARDADDALVEIDLAEPEADELGDPQPGGVEHLEHGPVPVAEGVAGIGRIEQRLDLVLAQRLRQRPADLRHRDLRGGVLARTALAHEPAEKSDGSWTAGGPRSGVARRLRRASAMKASTSLRSAAVIGRPWLATQRASAMRSVR
jgi:hypothetical protein